MVKVIFKDEREAASLAWQYFRVILPTNREKLRKKFKETCKAMRPGLRSNTKAGYDEMVEFYHSLAAVREPWAFVDMPFEQRRKRPNRGIARIRRMPQANRVPLNGTKQEASVASNPEGNDE